MPHDTTTFHRIRYHMIPLASTKPEPGLALEAEMRRLVSTINQRAHTPRGKYGSWWSRGKVYGLHMVVWGCLNMGYLEIPQVPLVSYGFAYCLMPFWRHMVYPIFNFTYQGIYREPRFLQLWCAALDISHGSDATGSLILNCSIPFLYFFSIGFLEDIKTKVQVSRLQTLISQHLKRQYHCKFLQSL
jgi:hypothetical protein